MADLDGAPHELGAAHVAAALGLRVDPMAPALPVGEVPPVSDDRRDGCAALLAGLPGMGPRRLTTLLDRWDPEEAWARVASEHRAGARPGRRSAGPTTMPGCASCSAGDDAYPDALREDLEPPAVLFVAR